MHLTMNWWWYTYKPALFCVLSDFMLTTFLWGRYCWDFYLHFVNGNSEWGPGKLKKPNAKWFWSINQKVKKVSVETRWTKFSSMNEKRFAKLSWMRKLGLKDKQRLTLPTTSRVRAATGIPESSPYRIFSLPWNVNCANRKSDAPQAKCHCLFPKLSFSPFPDENILGDFVLTT